MPVALPAADKPRSLPRFRPAAAAKVRAAQAEKTAAEERKHAPQVAFPVEKPEPAKAAPPTAKVEKVQPAAPKLGPGDDWMKASNVMKYNIDVDPMSKDIDAKENDVEEHRKFNLKSVGLVAKQTTPNRA